MLRDVQGPLNFFGEGMLVGDVHFVLETLLRPLVADVFARHSFFSSFFFFEYDCLISMISMCVTNKLLPRICRSFFSVSMLLRTQWIHLSGAKGMMATIKGDMEAEIENGKEQDKKNQA